MGMDDVKILEASSGAGTMINMMRQVRDPAGPPQRAMTPAHKPTGILQAKGMGSQPGCLLWNSSHKNRQGQNTKMDDQQAESGLPTTDWIFVQFPDLRTGTLFRLGTSARRGQVLMRRTFQQNGKCKSPPGLLHRATWPLPPVSAETSQTFRWT